MATKKRVELTAAPKVSGLLEGPVAVATVVDEKPGTVTTLDKLKGYYHSMIAVVGSTLVLLTQVSPVIPGAAKDWVSAGIAALTIALTFLKNNETWVDGL